MRGREFARNAKKRTKSEIITGNKSAFQHNDMELYQASPAVGDAITCLMYRISV